MIEIGENLSELLQLVAFFIAGVCIFYIIVKSK